MLLDVFHRSSIDAEAHEQSFLRAENEARIGEESPLRRQIYSSSSNLQTRDHF